MKNLSPYLFSFFLFSFFLGTWNLSLAQPANDNCVNSITLTINASCTNGTTVNGTIEGGEIFCDISPSQTVWYKFIATSTSHDVTVENFITGGCYLGSAVWSGVCLPSVQLSCEDAPGGPNIHVHSLSGLTPGNTYFVKVEYSSGGPCGAGQTFCIKVNTPIPIPYLSGFESCEPLFIYDGVQVPYNSTATPKSGTNHGQIDGACSGGTAGCYDGSIITGSQFTFQPGCTYKVSVWAKAAVATGNLAIAKSISGTNTAMKSASGSDIIMAATSVTSTPAYVQYTASFTVTATETKYIGFQMYRAGSGGTAGSMMYLDEISITKECGQCTNGIIDGDETGIDCAGILCASAAPAGGTISPSALSLTCGSGNFSLSLCGQTGNVQWQSSRDGSTWYDLSGQTGTAFAGTVRNTAYFRVKVTNDGCTPTPAYSNIATVTITGVGNKTWLTSGTNAWGTDANWSPFGFPTTCDNVTIPAGGIQPVITANAVCNDLTISAGAILTNSVGAVQYFSVYGNFKNDGTYNDAGAGTQTSLYGGNPSFIGGAGTFTNGNLSVAANANYILTSNIQVLNFEIQGNNGSFSLASNKLIVTTNWNQLGNFYANTGILELQQSGVISPATSNWGEGTLYLNITPPSLKTFSSFDDYYNLIFEDAGNTITIDVSPIIVLNDLTIKPGTALNFGASGNTINIGGSNPGGDWVNDGTFTSGISTVVFKGGYEQEIKGASATTFNNLTVNNTSATGVIVQTACSVNTVLTLTDGILNTDNFGTYIYLPSTASVSPAGGSANSYVDGYITKNGTTAFAFPTGDGSKWRRIVIGAPSASSTFRAKYWNAGFTDYTVTPPLTDVSQIEYWILDRMIGAGTATVTLYWEDASTSSIDDCPDLTVARWNGTSWTEQPATASGTCTGAGTGSVLTNAAVSSFSPFTFGSKSLLVNPLMSFCTPATFTVITTADAGAGSLRQAIINANANCGHDIINFSIGGAGPFTIPLLSALPNLTDNAGVTINGFTQSGASVNTVPVFSATSGTPMNGVYKIILGNSNNIATGLVLASDSNVIQGLVLSDFGDGTVSNNDIAITISGNSNIVLGCYIGMNVNGTTKGGTKTAVGISIVGVDNTIGDGTAAGANLISGMNADGLGTTFYGIWINGAGTTNNWVLENMIGLQNDGTTVVAGAYQGTGIYISSGAVGNVIGFPGDENVISGQSTFILPSMGIGILLETSTAGGNSVVANIIGPRADGTNWVTSNGQSVGIYISGSPDNQIGTASFPNIISANEDYGIVISGAGSTGNMVVGNKIGVSSASTFITNSDQGIGVFIDNSAANNIIGGSGASEGNIISGQKSSIGIAAGIYLYSLAASGNKVLGNIIGPMSDGITNLTSNAQIYGINIDNSPNNTIGGNTTNDRNIISANFTYGVYIAGAGSSGNVVTGNYIGPGLGLATVAGSSQDYGVYLVSSAANNTIGDTVGGEANMIAYNTTNGVYLTGALTTGNLISRNPIYSNTGKPINLNYGAGAANNGNPAPVISTAIATTVTGTSPANDTVEVFKNTTTNCFDAVNFVGQTTADGSGNWSLTGLSLSTGDYVLATASDAGNNTSEFSGCMAVVVNIIITETHVNVLCNGGNNGSIDITVSNGTLPYTYAWNDGPVTEDRINLTAGTYTVTVTDALLEVATKTVIITEPASPLSVSETHTDVTCPGGSNGTINITAGGGTPVYTYAWNDGPVTEDRVTIAAGTYTVTVTDSKSCTVTQSVTINTISTNSTAPTGATASVNPTCPGQSTNLSVTGGSLGTGADWQWYTVSCGGTPVGAGSPLSVSPAVSTTYYVRAEGTCNTTACASVTVNVTNTISTAPISATASIDPTCPGQSTNLSVTGGSLGTGADWQWYTVSCGGTPVGTGSPLSVSPAVSTTYYVRAEGTCNTTLCATVTVNVTNTISTAPISATASIDPTCPGQSTNLSVTGGSLGTGANWQWYSGSCGGIFVGSGSPLLVSPAVTTTYYVRAEGTCNTTTCASVTVNVTNTNSIAPTGATASVNPTCPSGATTLSQSGGSLGTGALYYWYSGSCGGTFVGNGSPSVSPAVTTTYYVRAEGTCNTTTCASVTVTVNSNPTLSETHTDVTCPGSNNGTINITVGGGTPSYSYTWSDGPVTEDRTNLSAGTYSITVTDATTCTVGLSVTITQPSNKWVVTSDVNGTTSDGVSLRWAITQANITCGHDTIIFNLGAGGPFTIALTAALPDLTDNAGATIDGWDNSGDNGTPNTDPVFSATAGTPMNAVFKIILGNSNNVPTGLVLASDSNVIQGLALPDFGDGTVSGNDVAITIAGNNNQVLGCYIGMDVTGTVQGGVKTATGIEISGVNNKIGDGTPAGANLISGFNGNFYGIYIYGAASGNSLKGNMIGLSKDGSTIVAGAMVQRGVFITGSAGSNTIGGSNPGEGNVISGNNTAGIYLNSSAGNNILGNILGPQANGTALVSSNPQQDGIWINNSPNNIIGGNSSGERNIISANQFAGIIVQNSGASGNIIKGNYIGTDITGTQFIANSSQDLGVDFELSAVNNTVGGTGANEGNVVSGNTNSGIRLLTVEPSGNMILGNIIGPQADGISYLASSQQSYGININGSSNNIIGGNTSADRNIISANENSGIYIITSASTGNVIKGNYIGIDKTGTSFISGSTQDYGVYITSTASGNIIGGSGTGEGNVISGNTNSGIYLFAGGNSILGNIIGPQANGFSYLISNAQSNGIYFINSANNTIGGNTPVARNIISANELYGIWIVGAGSTGNTIRGNFIGTDVNGTSFITNSSQNNGIYIETNAGNNIVGGSNSGERNLISGNTNAGISISTGASGNTLRGNIIGPQVDGISLIAFNLQNNGIMIGNSANNNIIGGNLSGEGNIISANEYRGISIAFSSSGNIIAGNYIGPGSGLANIIGSSQDYGIDIINSCTNNTIGGSSSGDENKIAFNTVDGINLLNTTTTGNNITRNPVYSNGAKAINLNYGVNQGNNGKAPPTITYADTSLVSGTSGVNDIVEVFTNATADSQDAKIYVGTDTADGAGNWVLAVSLADTLYIVATARDAGNNTSELSNMLKVVVPCNMTIADTIANVSCYGGSDGLIILTVGSGTPPYTYSWNTGNTTDTLESAAAGTYTVTITDAGTCDTSLSFTILEPSELLVKFDSLKNVTCNSGGDGYVRAAPEGGTPPYSYMWSIGGSDSVITALGSGMYLVTVFDSAGCQQTDSIYVGQPGVWMQKDSIGTDGRYYAVGFSIGSMGYIGTGFDGSSYKNDFWEYDPVIDAWTQKANFTGAARSLAVGFSIGNKGYIGTGWDGSSWLGDFREYDPGSNSWSIKANFGGTARNNAVGFSIGNKGYIGTGWDGGYRNDFWEYDPGGNSWAPKADFSGTARHRAEGFSIEDKGYIGMGNDGAYKKDFWRYNPSNNSWMQRTDFDGTAREDGVAFSIGSRGYVGTGNDGTNKNDFWEYNSDADSWTKIADLTATGRYAAVGFSIGNKGYTGTGYDGSYKNDFWEWDPDATNALTLAKSDLACNGDSSGTASATITGGTSPYTFIWSDGGTLPAILGLPAASYTVTVTDASGCTLVDSAVITQPALLSFSETHANVSCYNGNDGAINVTTGGGTSPFTYLWNDAVTSEDRTNLVAGTYSVIVTDSNSCSTSDSVAITQPALLSIDLDTVNASCTGTCDGKLTANVTGGIMPYTYGWGTGETSSVDSALCLGYYDITVADGNLCTVIASSDITEPVVTIAVIDGQNATCSDSCNGWATILFYTGAPAYTYLWNSTPPQSDTTATGLCAGTYTVTATDSRACSATVDATITAPAPLSAVLTATPDTCPGAPCEGTATATVSGGITPYSYSWNPSAQTTSIATDLCAGNYMVSINDANNCAITGNATITDLYILSTAPSTITATNDSICPGDSVTLTESGGSLGGGASWEWYTVICGGMAAGTSSSITVAPSSNTTYYVRAEGQCNTTACTSVTIYVNTVSSSPILASSSPSNICPGGSSTLAQNGGSLGTGAAWIWHADSCGGILVGTGSSIGVSPASTTTYFVRAEGTCNTTSCKQTTVTVNPSYSVSDTVPVCDGDSILINGNWYSTPVVITDSLLTFNGCDSIAVTTIIVNSTYFKTDTAAICSGDSILLPGGYQFTPGNYTDTLTTVYGCDSIIETTLTVNPAFNSTATAAICSGDSILLQGNYQTSAGIYYDTLYSINGCDSVIATTLTVNPSYSTTDPAIAICNGDSVSIYGVFRSITGNYYDSLTTLAGCDSIHSTSLTVNPIYNTPATATICSGDSIWLQGNYQTAPGTYNDTLPSVNGCDSIIFTTVTVITTVSLVTDTFICYGDSIQLPGGGYTSATGIYLDTLFSQSGCDSVIKQTNLTVNPVISLSTATTNASCFGICSGSGSVSVTGGTPPYGYAWSNGQNNPAISSLCAGAFTISVTDSTGCSVTDSIIVTEPAPINALINSFSDVSCFGDSGGSVTAGGTGGTPPYTYQWSNGSNLSSVTGLIAGTYSVTLTDSTGCSDTVSVTLTQPAQLVLNAVDSVNIACNGDSTGIAYAEVTGGTGPYTYYWSDQSLQITPAATGLTAGMYTVTVIDANTCFAYDSIMLTEPSTAFTFSVTGSSNPVCYGDSTGTITGQAAGGIVPYTFNWSGPITGSTVINVGLLNISNLPAGTYNIVVTDAGGCIQTGSAALANPAQIILSFVFTNTSCIGTNDGAINLTALNGTPPYTYAWSNGETINNIDSLTAGFYTITVTDNNSCSNVAVGTITEPAVVTVSMSTTNANCGAADGDATATASGGSGSFNYQWSNGATASIATGLLAGNYVVTVTDLNGCTGTASGTVINAGGPSATLLTNSASCAGTCNGDAYVNSVTGGTPPYAYSWSDGQTDSTATGLCAGTYYLTLSDAGGCIIIDSVIVTEPSVISVGITTANSTCGNVDGSATATASGGNGTFSYLWSDGQSGSNATGLGAGSYTVTATDISGCNGTASGLISDANGPTSSLSSNLTSCAGACDGDIQTGSVTGGTPPYTYSWSDGQTDSSATGLCAGTYYLTLSDAGGCIFIDSAIVTEPVAIAVVITTANSTCGNADGSATATASGGSGSFSYEWSDGQSGSTATGLAAGTYVVTATDISGCTASANAPVSDIGGPVITFFSISVSCSGGADGVASVSVYGGTPPYSYLWDDPSAQTDSVATGLPTGTYSVTVTDNSGCKSSGFIIVTEPAAISKTLSSTDATCGNSDGSATVTAVGGTGSYTYLWNTTPAQTGSTATGLATGIYSVSVSDSNGCSDSTTAAVAETGCCVIYAFIDSNTNVLCNGGSTAIAVASASGGTPPYTYQWSNGQSSTGNMQSTADSLSAGSYSVTVTDSAGCSDSISVTITEPLALNVAVNSITNVTCPGDATGMIDITTSGGIPPYTFYWVRGGTDTVLAGLNEDLTNQISGPYGVRIYDANGCYKDFPVGWIVGPNTWSINANITPAFCTTACNGSASVSVTGATAPYTYLWSTNATTTAITGLCPDTLYWISITDSKGCTIVKDSILPSYALPPAPAVASPVTYCTGDAIDSLSAQPLAGGIIRWYLTPPPGTVVSTGNSYLPLPVVGANYYYATQIISNCESETADIELLMNEKPVANAGENSVVCHGEAATLHATGGVTYAWKPVEGLSDPNIDYPIARPADTTVYYVTVTAANSCSAIDSVTVFVDFSDNCWHIYNMFSPNGDAHNDVWVIDGILRYPENRVTIYTRFEDKVIVLQNYDNEGVVWNGENRQGEPLPAGTYFYVIDIGEKKYNGWVQIIR